MYLKRLTKITYNQQQTNPISLQPDYLISQTLYIVTKWSLYVVVNLVATFLQLQNCHFMQFQIVIFMKQSNCHYQIVTFLWLPNCHFYIVNKLSLPNFHFYVFTKFSLRNCCYQIVTLPSWHYQILITELSLPNLRYQKSALPTVLELRGIARK